MGTVHELRTEGKKNDVEQAMGDLTRAMRRTVDRMLEPGASFGERETVTLWAANEATRRCLEQVLSELSDAYADELLIDGVLHRRSHDPSPGHYHSLNGTLNVPRATYRRVGERNGPTVVPLELEAGIVEGATPALGFSIAHDLGERTSRAYVKGMAAAHRIVPSRSTVEKLAIAIGTSARQQAPKIEPALRLLEGVPDVARAISLGLDRVTVPFEEVREQGAPPKTKRKPRTTPYVRKAPPPVDVNFHLAYLGTVSFVDGGGTILTTRKYVATHHEGPSGIIARMMADVNAGLERVPTLKVLLAQDGAPELWKLMFAALDAEPRVEEYYVTIDRYHLNERLGKVLVVLVSDEGRRAKELESWNRWLDEDDGGIFRIEQSIEVRKWRYTGKELQVLADTLTFIANNNDRLRYATLLKEGLPVGSGATEGACKSVVNVRAKRSGQRWHDEGVSAILTLRAIEQSDRLPQFWKLLANHYTARIDQVAA